jgi:vacuolar protein 8
LIELSKCDDARVQRDTARCFSTLTQTDDVRAELIAQNALPAVLTLAKSLDIASQRYASLTLCNLSCSIPAHKIRLIDDGALRPIIFLSRFPDTEIQRYSALSLAGLALGGHGNNKLRIVEEGSMKPLIDLIKFPDRDVQLAAAIAVNAIVIGPEQGLLFLIVFEHFASYFHFNDFIQVLRVQL